MKAWYVPTWNGDVRIEPSTDDPKGKCTLSVFHPTADERESLSTISELLVERKWLAEPVAPEVVDQRFTIDAPIEEVGPVVAAALRRGPASSRRSICAPVASRSWSTPASPSPPRRS